MPTQLYYLMSLPTRLLMPPLPLELELMSMPMP
jgi:hypothetical protein